MIKKFKIYEELFWKRNPVDDLDPYGEEDWDDNVTTKEIL